MESEQKEQKDQKEEKEQKTVKVYESPNPEVDFEVVNEGRKKVEFSYDKQVTESIDTNKIPAVDIFKKFALIDKRAGSKPRISHDPASRTVPLDETPMQKLTRLKQELEEFGKELAFVAEKSSEIQEKARANGVLEQLKGVRQEIEELGGQREKFEWYTARTRDFPLESQVGLLKEEIQRKLTERILAKLTALKETRILEKNEEHSSDAAKFEFILGEEHETLRKMIRYQELERRLQSLERLVGISQASKNRESSLVAKLKTLYEFADCLNLSKLESLGKNIQNINIELDQLIYKNKLAKITASEGEKIEELHEKFLESDTMLDEIPRIVDRLESLKALHEESAGLALNLSCIKNSQTFIKGSLENNVEVLKQLEESFAENLSVMNKNLGLLEKRLEKIKGITGVMNEIKDKNAYSQTRPSTRQKKPTI